MSDLRDKALALYKPPFRFIHGYIYDADSNMVADDGGILRVRGWGRISYMDDAAALQDEVGSLIADALTDFWNRLAAPSESDGGGK